MNDGLLVSAKWPAAALVIITAALVPVLIMVHEFGHLVAGSMIGVPRPEVGLAGFAHAPAPWLASWQVAVLAGAGPAVTLALAITGMVLARRTKAGLANSICVAACMRLIELFPFSAAAVGRWLRRSPYRVTTFDEDRAFQALGLSGDLGLVAATLALGSILFVALYRSRGAAFAYMSGGVLGWAAWAMMVRP